MSRAPGAVCPAASGNAQPSAETPVRITSIGCADEGSSSSTDFTEAGRLRSDFSFVLYAFSSAAVGNLPCTKRCAISSNSLVVAKSRMS